MSARALVFDLDDTLYPERRFVLSGFAAVARAIEADAGVPACETFRSLVRALKGGHRASAFQRLCDRHGLDPRQIDGWVQVMRTHVPRLRLARRTRRMLADLRSGWRLGLITNGLPEVQQKKVECLGLTPFFDHIAFPGLPGAGGKPAPEPFLLACRALGVTPGRAVFVGDDMIFDMLGARGVGMRTIHLAPRPALRRGWSPDATVRDITDVPAAAEALVQDA
ncbi:MAG: HAD-IA family hydrolase [Acidobacteriota bacterium]